MRERCALFLPVRLTQGREAREERPAGVHGLAEDHEKPTTHGEVAEEEVHVEDEAVADSLHDDDRKETADRVFRVFPRDDCSR